MQDLELKRDAIQTHTPVESKLCSKSNQYDKIIELL